MGFGKRSDFTKVPQQSHDPGFLYDHEKNQSIANRVSRNKQLSQAMNTFGTSYAGYDKSVVGESLQHWQGRGPACNLGNDGTDMKLLKRKV